MQKSYFLESFLFFDKNVLSLQNFRKKHLENGNEWISKRRINFAFWRTSHSAESNSSAGDVFSFLIYAFSMQIHSFPLYGMYHYAILHYFWNIVILDSFFERWVKIWLTDNRNIKNKQKKNYFFHIWCNPNWPWSCPVSYTAASFFVPSC